MSSGCVTVAPGTGTSKLLNLPCVNTKPWPTGEVRPESQAPTPRRQANQRTALETPLANVGSVKRNVDDSFEFDWLALPRRRTELPLAQGVHCILVEFLVDPPH